MLRFFTTRLYLSGIDTFLKIVPDFIPTGIGFRSKTQKTFK